MLPKTKLIFPALLCLFFSQTAWSQKENYEVYALKFAAMGTHSSIADWVDKGPVKDSIDIYFMVWLIKGKEGKNILLDAGFLNDIKDADEFAVKDYMRPDSTLLKLGLKPTDITDIIISHPHWDHIDGIDLFTNAHVWMQKEDFNYCVSAAWQKGGNHGGFNKRDIRKLLELNLTGKLTLVDGDDKEIAPGVKVFTGSRHTYNSQYVLVETGSNKIVLASDNIWIYYNLEHLRPASTGGTFDTTGYIKTMQRMKTQVSNTKFIIPGHDARIFSVFPKIAEGIVQIK
jgi:glyoxylase-like metal-dependent hydrolase (beta-lactamase superfamily II)